MSDCRRTVEQLAPYVDGELSAPDRATIERHLDACPPCRRAAEQTAGGRTVLRRCSAVLREEPLPPGLRARCEALAREQGRSTGRTVWRRLLPAAAIAALLIVTASTLLAFATRRSDMLLAGQLAIDHAKCFRVGSGASDIGGDAHRAEALFRERYGWNVHVPPSSAAEGITLVGARRCLYAEGTIPHVMYRMGGEDVSLYVLDEARRRDADVTALGHRARIWSDGAATYVLVASGEGVDFERAVRYVSQRVR